MKKKSELIRNYTDTDSDLFQRFDIMHNTTFDNIKHFETFNFTVEDLAKMKKTRVIFSNQPTDEEIKAIGIRETNKKKQAHKDLESALTAVLSRIKLQFGKDSLELKQAGGEGLTNYSDADFCQKARRVERTGRQYLKELKAVNLTTEILDNLKKATDLFDDLIDNQKDIVVQREKKTRERVSLGNEVYANCVKLHDIANAVLPDINPELLDNYRLTDIQRKKNNTSEETDDKNNEENEASDDMEETKK